MDKITLLEQRKNRVIATILGWKDKNINDYLPSDVSDELRKIILDQVNDLTDLAFELIEDNAVVWNEEFMVKLDHIIERLPAS